MEAALLAQMLARQLSGPRIENPHGAVVPLDVHLTTDEARWRAVECRIHLDASVQVHAALAELVEAKRFERALWPAASCPRSARFPASGTCAQTAKSARSPPVLPRC